MLCEGAAGDTSVAEDRPRRAYRPYLAGVTFHRCCNARPAPDALDELRDTVHSITIMRHDAAHVSLHVRQLSVVAREQQQPAFARAVVCERHLITRITVTSLSCF